VLGNGVEGEVVAVGDDVDPSLLGRQVVTATGGFGGYADRVVVDAGDPVPVPDGLALGEAVALLADGRTALALARAAAITAEDRVLITAAAGGVGSLLVQLARAAGARHVVAAAGGERKLALARDLGADLAVDYTRDGWAGAVHAATEGIDVVLDGVGGTIGLEAIGLVVPGGRALIYGAASGTTRPIQPGFPSAASRSLPAIPSYARRRTTGHWSNKRLPWPRPDVYGP
jgi:NADPH2:quinone reductase